MIPKLHRYLKQKMLTLSPSQTKIKRNGLIIEYFRQTIAWKSQAVFAKHILCAEIEKLMCNLGEIENNY